MTGNLGALSGYARVIWHACGCEDLLTRPVLPLTHSTNRAFRVSLTRCVSRERFLSLIHPSEGCSHFFLLLCPPSRLLQAGIARFVCVCVFSPFICFLSAVPFARSSGGWYQQSFVPSYLRDTEDWRGVARGQAHHDRRRREGVFLGGGHRSLRRGTNQTATLGGLALSFDGFRGAGAQVHRVRGEESVRLRKVSDGL